MHLVHFLLSMLVAIDAAIELRFIRHSVAIGAFLLRVGTVGVDGEKTGVALRPIPPVSSGVAAITALTGKDICWYRRMNRIHFLLEVFVALNAAELGETIEATVASVAICAAMGARSDGEVLFVSPRTNGCILLHLIVELIAARKYPQTQLQNYY